MKNSRLGYAGGGRGSSESLVSTYDHGPRQLNKPCTNIIPFSDEVIVTNSREIINVINPTQFELKNAYPNPFNSITNIEFSIPMDSYVTVKIYNLLGKEISTLVDNPLQTGFHNVNWDAQALPSGVYFVKLNAGEFTQTQKLMLVK